MKKSVAVLGLAGALAAACVVLAQERPERRERPDGPPGGFAGGPPQRGGFGGPNAPETRLVGQFDKDGDKILNKAERDAAREFIKKEKAEGRGPRRPGPPGGFGPRGGEEQVKPAAGEKLAPADVKTYGDEGLYESGVLRTLFFTFESPDWEAELADFYNTDVEVPAQLVVDGKTYKDVGVHFRGASSFFTVGESRKRSLNVSIDFADSKQKLGGHQTLNLLNSHTDPSFLRTILYYQVAREYVPAPKANLVRVVLNGESWGIYVNAQQFNKEFVKEWFPESKGARWKVPGSPRGRGGLEYLGNDAEAYKRIYEIKTKDDAKSWDELIRLCRVLNETPADKLVAELSPILDIDGALKFLAIENALINNDGYWTRASDYNLCQDEKGRFHFVPHDANETFRPAQGPGMRGGGGGEGGPVGLDPLAGMSDADKPLLGKLLAAPELRAKYFGYVKQIAEESLDWRKLGPVAEKYHALIAEDVKKDTHKLSDERAFADSLTKDPAPPERREGQGGPGFGRRGPGGGPSMSLKSFVEQRRAFLLNHPEVKEAKIPKS